MKLMLAVLCLLLCGCSQEAPPPETTVPTAPVAEIQETQPTALYVPGHPLEEAYQGGLQVYPLPQRKTQGVLAMGNGLLTFSGYGSTTLTLLTGDTLQITASKQLDFELSYQDPSVRIHTDGISFYNSAKQETILLDAALNELERIHIPGTVLGSPILSSDKTTLFYCTPTAILAWNLESGIHRTVKELSYDHQALTELLSEDTILQCHIQDGSEKRTMFLDTVSGRLLTQAEGHALVETQDQYYYATLPISGTELLLFGQIQGQPQILYPQASVAAHYFLPRLQGIVTVSMMDTDRASLSFYSLETGTCQTTLTLAPLEMPKSVLADATGKLFLLTYDPGSDQDILYRWDISAPVFAAEDASQICIEAYPGTGTADPQALAQCQAYAQQLSQRFDIQIRIGQEAAQVQPWDYRFEAETMPRVLHQELTLLEQRLSRYPAAVLEKTRDSFGSLTLCLVREISGTSASGSLDIATGVQFLQGSDAYVVIAAGKYAEQALYHELYHVMETRILSNSSAMDQWNDWNPEGFSYTQGNEPSGDLDHWLSGETQAFIDTYSMTFPKEDRARVFEYAMLPGARTLFASETMQTKLSALCQAIRQAYGLRTSPETFPWEQYLNTSLADTQ